MPDFSDIVSLVRGPIPERPPVAIWAVPPTTNGVIGGVPDMIRFYFDLEERLSLEHKLHRLLPEAIVLPGFWPSLGVVVEASAFGGQMVWSRRAAPHIHPALRSPGEVDSLKSPKAGEAGLTPLFLTQMESMKRMLEKEKLELSPIIKSMGPAEIAGLLLGYGAFFLGLYDEPGRIKTLLSIITEFIIEWLHLQEAIVGKPQILQLAEHVPGQISSEQVEEFVLPYMKTIYSEFPNPVKIYHNESWHSDRSIDVLLRFGAEIWHFGSDVHRLPDLYSKIGDVIVPFGGVNPHGPMRHGTAEEVRTETRQVLEAARGRRLLLSTGTGTTPETTLENVRAMIETAVYG
jgi:uroporphyrinogen-III decarboxylase